MFFHKIHAELDMLLGIFGSGPFMVVFFLYHPCIMQKSAGKANEDFPVAEMSVAEMSAVKQPRHGQVGISYVPEIMIIGVTGFVFFVLTFIQVNGKFKNPVDRLYVKLGPYKFNDMQNLLMNCFRRCHIDEL